MDFELKHDSWDIHYRKPFGAVEKGKTIYISILSDRYLEIYLELIYFDYSEKSVKMDISKYNDAEYLYYYYINLEKNYEGLINYYFRIYVGKGKHIYYGNNYDGLGGKGQIYYDKPKPYQITVYEPFKVPEWFKEGIVYQILVDRFKNGNEDGRVLRPKKNIFIHENWDDEPVYIKDSSGDILKWDFFGGNLQGVIQKLKYIKSLGVNAIYLNPIFESASNHKYDTGDYKVIDQMYGDENIFKKLCKEAKKLDIRIILDGVFSHTGDDSRYFNKYGNYDSLGAYQSKDSPYYNWYRFNKYPDEYECWWGIDNMPNVDEMENTYIDFIISGKNSVLKKWMDTGVSGWRLDVADELPDEFIEKIRTRIKGISHDSVLIGEVWEDASNKISYSKRRKYVFGHELDSVINYPFRDALIDFLIGITGSRVFQRRILSLYENYPKEIFYSSLNVIGTHDTERILTVLSKNGKNGIALLNIAVAIQMTLPGVPVIYYGDEVGVLGGSDPENRKTYPWKKQNKHILSFYKNIVELRNKLDSLKKGDIKFYNVNENILCYERTFEEEKTLILANRSQNESFDVKIKELYVKILPYEIKVLQE
ncbi:alpha-amylase family glycosyl hydrolase [Clostridium sp. LBM24168]